MIFLSTLLFSVLVTTLSIPLLSRLAFHYQLLDIPEERKVHSQPIPRIGGVAMAIGALLPIVYWQWEERMVASFLAGAAVIVIFGLLDDVFGISPAWKFSGQVAAALLAVIPGGIRISTLGSLLPDGIFLPESVSVLLTVLAIIGVTNAINLADGLDGLAGGISLLSLACIGLLAYLDGNFTVGLVSLSLCGAVFGFLRHNTFPASIFMGDTGSQLLGYSAITMSLALTQGSTPLSPLLPLIILGFPVLDTLTVMTRRILKKKSPFLADKAHFHHSLLALGLHQTESVLIIYVIQSLLILSAYRFRYDSEWLLLFAYLAFSVTILMIFYQSNRHNWQPKRFAFITRTKAFLCWLRDDTSLMKYLFGTLQVVMPLMLLLTVFLSINVLTVLKAAALVTAMALTVVLCFFRDHIHEWTNTAIYLLIPIAVYYSDLAFSSSPDNITGSIYNGAFVFLAILNIIVSKLTKRKTGFRSTPLDFLILFMVLTIPNIQQTNLQDFRLGLIAFKIIILYFSYEILFAELRGNCLGIGKVVLAALAGLALKLFVE